MVKQVTTVFLENYKRRACERKIEFNLSTEEFLKIVKSNCFYCNVEPQQKKLANKTCNGAFTYNGIDRVDSNKGYIVGNVVPCCKNCNFAKLKMTKEEFYSWIERVFNNLLKSDIVSLL